MHVFFGLKIHASKPAKRFFISDHEKVNNGVFYVAVSDIEVFYCIESGYS